VRIDDRRREHEAQRGREQEQRCRPVAVCAEGGGERGPGGERQTELSRVVVMPARGDGPERRADDGDDAGAPDRDRPIAGTRNEQPDRSRSTRRRMRAERPAVVRRDGPGRRDGGRKERGGCGAEQNEGEDRGRHGVRGEDRREPARGIEAERGGRRSNDEIAYQKQMPRRAVEQEAQKQRSTA
jgi:hypothetical protein